MLNQKQIDKLVDISEKYKCEFHLPPINKSLNPFYNIIDLKDDGIRFKEFLQELKKNGIRHKFVDVDNKNLMEVYKEK